MKFSALADFDALLGGDSPLEADNADVAADLASRGFAVFPICDWGDGDGPKPIRDFIAKASNDPATVARWWSRWPDARVGLLTGEPNGVTVLDLDIKNGKNGIAALAALGFTDLAALSPVRVRTPSGGWHLFFRYEPRLKNSVSRIADGIDVKTQGGFVVAPGSFKDGARYVPDGAQLGAVDLPAFPEALIPPAEPEREPVAIVGDASPRQREWAAAHLGKLADGLAATTEGGRNDTLNSVAMWAGGAAAHGFIDRDSAETALLTAAEAAGMPKREARRTFAGAFKAGLRKPISDFPRDITGGDFDALDGETCSAFDDVLGGGGDDLALLGGGDHVDGADPVTARLNLQHAIVLARGRTLVTTERRDGSVDFGTVRDLHNFYENDRVAAGDNKTEAASRRWMRSPYRRSYPDGVTFAPGGCDGVELNLWRGWAVEPDAAASCALFLEHVRDVICRGNDEHAAYVIGWLAHMVQHPEEKPGVAIVLKGSKGAGKDTMGDYVAAMIGRRHAPTVAESSHIVGKFNARLESALLLHVQEGSWAGDRKAEGVLKYITTSDHVEIERKGIDSINLPSVLRLFISANADWVVPASPDERRWAVFEVSDARRGDRDYFAALRREMKGSGPAALLHHLRNYDLAGFNVRAAPETDGLRNQKLASLRGWHLWWFEVLNRGSLLEGYDSGDWETTWQTIGRDALRHSYVEWLKGRKFDGDAIDGRQFGVRLRELAPAVENKRAGTATRIYQYRLPPLPDCRAGFDQWIGAPVDWGDES